MCCHQPVAPSVLIISIIFTLNSIIYILNTNNIKILTIKININLTLDNINVYTVYTNS